MAGGVHFAASRRGGAMQRRTDKIGALPLTHWLGALHVYLKQPRQQCSAA